MEEKNQNQEAKTEQQDVVVSERRKREMAIRKARREGAKKRR